MNSITNGIQTVAKGTGVRAAILVAGGPVAVSSAAYDTTKTALGILGTGLSVCTLNRVEFFRNMSDWTAASIQIPLPLFWWGAAVIQRSQLDVKVKFSKGIFTEIFMDKVYRKPRKKMKSTHKRILYGEKVGLKERAVSLGATTGYALGSSVTRTADLAIGILCVPASLLTSLVDVITWEKVETLHKVNREFYGFTVNQLAATKLIYDLARSVRGGVDLLTR